MRGGSIDVVKAILAHSSSADMTRERYAQSDLCRDVIKALVQWQADVAAMVRAEDPLAFDARGADGIERETLGEAMTIPTAAPASNVIPMPPTRRRSDGAPTQVVGSHHAGNLPATPPTYVAEAGGR